MVRCRRIADERGGSPCQRPKWLQIASAPVSPVRMRMAPSMWETKILPSPMRPVWAALRIASTAGRPSRRKRRLRSSPWAGNRRHIRRRGRVRCGPSGGRSPWLRYRNSLEAGLLQRLLHFVELERLDDRLDLFHVPRYSSSPRVRAAARAGPARAGLNSIGAGIALPGACQEVRKAPTPVAAPLE